MTASKPFSSDGKVSAYNAGDLGSIPGSGRSPGEGNDNPLQYSCLENPMDGGAWGAIVHGVAKSRTRLSDFTHSLMQLLGLPWWLRGQSICRQCGFNPWVRKTPWRRKWQPTPVFSPGKSHEWRSLEGYIQRVRHN